MHVRVCTDNSPNDKLPHITYMVRSPTQSRQCNHCIVEIAKPRCIPSDILCALRRDHSRPGAVDNLDTLAISAASRQPRNSSTIESSSASNRANLVVIAVHVDSIAARARQNNRIVNRILAIIYAISLSETVPRARGTRKQLAIPHHTRSFAVRGLDLTDIRGAGLVRRHKRWNQLLPSIMGEPVGVTADVAAADRFFPYVANVVALATVVPGNYLDEVGLQLEDLGHAVDDVGFAASVPVLAGVDVFELEG